MKNILYIILLLSATYSQTDVSGVVSGSWTLDGSPYNVVNDVDVITTLDIEPGVIVIFFGDYDINVYGQLTANGTEENPIYFQSYIPDNTVNSQIVFNNSWNGCSLTHIGFIDLANPVSTDGDFTMEVSDISATNINDLFFGGRDVSNISISGKTGTSTILSGSNIDGLTVTDSEGTILDMTGRTLINATFDGIDQISGNGIISGFGTLENISFSNCYSSNSNSRYAIDLDENGVVVEMTKIDIQHNEIGGIKLAGVNVSINYLNISHNIGHGIYKNAGSGATYINHATIIWNSGDGFNFWLSDPSIGIINSVCYWNGGSCDIVGNYNCWQGYDENPMYLDFETYELHPDSPLIDGGNENMENDVCFPPSMGTSIPDIGHNGGPGACNWDESYEPSNAGCTDPSANNYDPDATYNDGSCEYDVYGCTDPSANNYNPDANIDDGNCTFDCEGSNPEGCFANGCPDGYLCVDDWENNCVASACSCDSDTGGWMCTDDCNGGTCFESTSGCTYPEATNFDPYAIEDDGSCEFGEFEDCEEVFNEGYELGAQSGDVNLDGLSNILDIVMMVNNILNP